MVFVAHLDRIEHGSARLFFKGARPAVPKKVGFHSPGLIDERRGFATAFLAIDASRNGRWFGEGVLREMASGAGDRCIRGQPFVEKEPSP